MAITRIALLIFAAGRRSSITLENIMAFATASENEPVLGYGVAPSIHFAEALSAYPTANTCINRLTLAFGDNLPTSQEAMFDVFDMSFVNTHFGLA